MLEGAGKSTRASLAIFSKGWVFRRLDIIKIFVVEKRQRRLFEPQVPVKVRAEIMTYTMLFLLGGIMIGLIGIASNPSPYFAALGLVVVAGVGCGTIGGHGGGFLSLVLFLIYLGGILVVFAYTAALAAEPYPENWLSTTVTIYAMAYLGGVAIAGLIFSEG